MHKLEYQRVLKLMGSGATKLKHWLVALVGMSFWSLTLVSQAVEFRGSYKIYSGDYNGDGLQDLYIKASPLIPLVGIKVRFPVVLDSDAPELVLQQNADGTYVVIDSPSQASLDAVSWGASTYNLFTGDFDDDGYLDFVVQANNASNASMFIYGSGASSSNIAQYLSEITVGIDVSSDNATLTVSDVDNNGTDDLVIWQNGVIESVVYVSGSGFTSNHIPDLSAIDDQLLDACSALTMTVSAVDLEGDDLSFSAINLPAFAQLTDHGDGTASVSVGPDTADVNSYAITIAVNDGTHTSSDEYSLTVKSIGSSEPCGSNYSSLVNSTSKVLAGSLGSLLTETFFIPPSSEAYMIDVSSDEVFSVDIFDALENWVATCTDGIPCVSNQPLSGLYEARVLLQQHTLDFGIVGAWGDSGNTTLENGMELKPLEVLEGHPLLQTLYIPENTDSFMANVSNVDFVNIELIDAQGTSIKSCVEGHCIITDPTSGFYFLNVTTGESTSDLGLQTSWWGDSNSALSNGVSLSGLEKLQDDIYLQSFTVPANVESLMVQASPGESILIDLFDQLGTKLTDCGAAPCVYNNPVAGEYFVRMTLLESIDSFSITAAWGGEFAGTLHNNFPLSNLSGETDQQLLHALYIPADAEGVAIQVSNVSSYVIDVLDSAGQNVNSCASVSCTFSALPAGLYFVRVTLGESAANISLLATWTEVDYPIAIPVLDEIADFTDEQVQTITGQADAGATIQLYNNNVLVDTVVASLKGLFASNAFLDLGVNVIHAVALDGVSISAASNSVNIAYQINSGTSEPVLNDGTTPTNHNPFTISGTAQANATINVYVAGDVQTIIVSDASGRFTTEVTLVEGTNSISVTEGSGEEETAHSNSLAIDYIPGLSLTPVSGQLSGTPFVSGEIYEVTGPIEVVSGATLSIPAGTIFRFEQGFGILVQAGGILNIIGDEANPVKLTIGSDSHDQNYWNGIHAYNGSQINIDHTVIEYAVDGLKLWSDVSGFVTHSDIRYNGDGVDLPNDSLEGQSPEMNWNNIYENSTNVNVEYGRVVVLDALNNWWGSNDVDVIEDDFINGGGVQKTHIKFAPYLAAYNGSPIIGENLSNEISGAQTLNAGTYLVDGDLQILAGAGLTVPAGVTLKFTKDARITVNSGSTFTLLGSEESPVLLTALDSSPESGDWYGIEALENSAVIFDYGIVEYAENAVQMWALVTGSISHSDFRNNLIGMTLDGTYSSSSQSAGAAIKNNNFYDNTFNLSLVNGSGSDNAPWVFNWDVENNWWGSADVNFIVDSFSNTTGHAIYDLGHIQFAPFLLLYNGPDVAGENLSGSISSTQTLSESTYYVDGHVSIASGMNLTISEGVTMQFIKDAKIIVESGATLTVQGTENNPVILSPVSITDEWGGIEALNGSSINIDYAVVEYASSGILIYPSVSGFVTHSDIRFNSSGIELAGHDGVAGDVSPVIEWNNIYGNGENVSMFDGSGVSEWFKIFPFVQSDDVYWSNPPAITYERFESNWTYVLELSNNWWGSEVADVITNGFSNTVGEYEFLHAGYGWQEYIPYSGHIGHIKFTPYLTSYNGTPVDGENLSGEISGNEALTSTTTYFIDGPVRISIGANLTIPAGTTVKFAKDAKIIVDEGGTLTIAGTSSVPVVLTSLLESPSAGDWHGIDALDGAVIEIDNAVIEYAEYGLKISRSVTGSVSHTDIRYNQVGIGAEGADSPSGATSPLIEWNNVYDNEKNIAIVDTSEIINVAWLFDLSVENNWWGSTDVDVIEGGFNNEFGSEGASIAHIQFAPYLDAYNGAALVGQNLTGDIASDQTLSVDTYYIDGHVTILSGANLTVPAGTNIRFSQKAKLIIADGGTLTLAGNVDSWITLTSMDDSPEVGDWYGVEALEGSVIDIKYTLIEYAEYGLKILSSATGSVSNSDIRYNVVAIDFDGTDGNVGDLSPVIESNNIYNNGANISMLNGSGNDNGEWVFDLSVGYNWWGNSDAALIENDFSNTTTSGTNAVGNISFSPYLLSYNGAAQTGHRLAGDITANQTLSAETHLIDGQIRVLSGANLTVPAGAVLEFSEQGKLSIDSGATLTLEGSEGALVTLTAMGENLEAGSWYGIEAAEGAVINIDYAVIEYAQYGLKFVTSVTGAVTHSDIRYNVVGIDVNGTQATVGDLSPVIEWNNIYQNDTNLVVLDGSGDASDNGDWLFDLEVSKNWWGSSDLDSIESGFSNTTRYDSYTGAHIKFAPHLVDYNGLEIDGQYLGGDIVSSQSLEAATYLVDGVITIQSGANLTIPDGAIIRFAKAGKMLVESGATLTVAGTEDAKAIFTALDSDAESGDWKGIEAETGANINIQYAVIEFAENAVKFAPRVVGSVSHSDIRDNEVGINVDGYYHDIGDLSPIIEWNNIFDNSKNIEMLNGSGNSNGSWVFDLEVRNNWWGSSDIDLVQASFSNVTTYTNFSVGHIKFTPYLTAYDGLPLIGQNLSGDIDTTQALSVGTYLVDGQVRVLSGVNLTIPAGAILKFASDAKIVVEDGATLTLTGTADSVVTLTSMDDNPEKGSWFGIEALDGSTINIDYSIIEYATYGLLTESGTVTGAVTNSGFRFNVYGLYLASDGVFIIDRNLITNNDYGIYLAATNSMPQPTITNNTIMENSMAGLYLFDYEDAVIVLEIHGNWWGSATPVLGSSNGVDVRFSSTDSSIAPINSPATTPISAPLISGVAVSNGYISPVGNSSLTSIQLTANLDQSANWTVEVLNSAKVVVNAFSGSASSIDVSWDGRNSSAVAVADGQYSFVLSATSANGTSLPEQAYITVDSTLPSADISDALNGVSSATVMSITGVAGDNHFLSYALAYGEGINPGSYTAIGLPSLSGVSGGVLLDWTTVDGVGQPLLPNGTHTLLLSVTDNAGNTASDQITINFDNILISNVSHTTSTSSTMTIDPSAGEYASVAFDLNKPATVSLRLYTEDSDILTREISQSFNSGNHQIDWDGKDSAGAVVGNNAYYFQLYATDGSDEAYFSEDGGGTTVNIPGSFTTALNAYENRVFKNTFTAPSPACDGGCRTQLVVSGCDSFIALEEQFEPGEYTVGWDLRDASGKLIEGTCQLLLTDFVTLRPNSIIVKNESLEFNLKGTGDFPEVEIQSNPYVVYHSYDQLSTVEYHLDRSAYVTVTLLPPNITDPLHPSAIELTERTLLTASEGGDPYSFTWKGYEDVVGERNNVLVSEEGPYTYLIEAESESDGSLTSYRGFITLFH